VGKRKIRLSRSDAVPQKIAGVDFQKRLSDSNLPTQAFLVLKSNRPPNNLHGFCSIPTTQTPVGAAKCFAVTSTERGQGLLGPRRTGEWVGAFTLGGCASG
jgi:hypothetical protein